VERITYANECFRVGDMKTEALGQDICCMLLWKKCLDQENDMPEKGPDENFCRSCGEVVKKEAEICPKCGVRQREAPKTKTVIEGASDKSRLVATVLAGLLGMFGAHRFYVGKTGSAVAQLLIGSWITLGIWPLIDFIRILVGDFKDDVGKPILNWDN